MRGSVRPRTSPFEIHVPVKPRTYTRGAGPPLADLFISLRNDSTARIVEKMVLPLEISGGRIRQQMHYIVQWTDLPAASAAIPAKNILDYVSPRMLEDFEYSLSLERDHADEEHRRMQEAFGGPLTQQQHPQQQVRGPGRHGVNSTLNLMMTDKAAAETAALALSVTSTKGPSLSTPQKSFKGQVMEDTTDLDDEEGDEEASGDNKEAVDAAIYRQLFADSEPGSEVQDDGDHLLKTPPTTSGSVRAKSGANTKLRQSRIMGMSALSGWTLSVNSEGSAKPSPRNHGNNKSSFMPASTTVQQVKTAHGQAWPVLEQPNPEETITPKEQEFEVQRLEGDTIDVINGVEKRWFKVRWKGDWPKDQNPTWEPEENLPTDLVQAYSRRNGSRKSVPKRHFAKLHRYASVAEAFEDGGLPADSISVGNRRDDDLEERLEVESEDHSGRSGSKAPMTLGLGHNHIPMGVDFTSALGMFGNRLQQQP
jgi:hypothetical protein